jgi:hypothetical protein
MLSSCISYTTVFHPSLFDVDVILHSLPRLIIHYSINSLLPIVQWHRRHCGMSCLRWTETYSIHIGCRRICESNNGRQPKWEAFGLGFRRWSTNQAHANKPVAKYYILIWTWKNFANRKRGVRVVVSPNGIIAGNTNFHPLFSNVTFPENATSGSRCLGFFLQTVFTLSFIKYGLAHYLIIYFIVVRQFAAL